MSCRSSLATGFDPVTLTPWNLFPANAQRNNASGHHFLFTGLLVIASTKMTFHFT
jgi:hypothetical protein